MWRAGKFRQWFCTAFSAAEATDSDVFPSRKVMAKASRRSQRVVMPGDGTQGEVNRHDCDDGSLR